MDNFNTFDSRNAVPENEKIIVLRDWQMQRLIQKAVVKTMSRMNLDNSTADRACQKEKTWQLLEDVLLLDTTTMERRS